MSQVRGVVPLFVASFIVHAMLLVNSAETELINHQQPIGTLLSQQLALSAAPLMINKDSVGLGLLANDFGAAQTVLGLRIVDNHQQTVATGGQAQSQKGLIFKKPIVLEKQHLGEAQITLSTPERGDIIKNNKLNLALSFLIHALLMCWFAWPKFFQNLRVPAVPTPAKDETLPKTVEPMPTPQPVKAAVNVWVRVSFDDLKGLMSKVNAHTSAQFLQVIDKLIKRTTRLYAGKIQLALSADGVMIRFEGDQLDDCAHRALLSTRLLIKLATSAHYKRREAKQFSLRVKAALINLGELSDEAAQTQLTTLLSAAKVEQIIIADDASLLASFKDKHTLLAFSPTEDSPKAHQTLNAHVVESLAAPLEDELSVLEQRILERKKEAL